eukprot:1772942-Rhodomonas_salina.2
MPATNPEYWTNDLQYQYLGAYKGCQLLTLENSLQYRLPPWTLERLKMIPKTGSRMRRNYFVKSNSYHTSGRDEGKNT